MDLEIVIPYEEIKCLETEEIRARKETMQALTDAGIRRTLFYPNIVEGARMTKGLPQNIRIARIYAYHLGHIDLDIHETDLLIGSITGMWPVDEVQNQMGYDDFQRLAVKVIEKKIREKQTGEEKRADVWGNKGGGSFEENAGGGKLRWASLMARDHYDGNIPFHYLQKLIREMGEKYNADAALEPYEIGKWLEDYFVFDYGPAYREAVAELNWNPANHTSLNFPKVLQVGFCGLAEEIEACRQTAETDDLRLFYEGTGIVVEAVRDFIRRYGDKAKLQGKKAATQSRREELKTAAQILYKIADDKAETFHEAVQLVWILHLISNLLGGSAMSLARFDQYMVPFYEKDTREGRLDDTRAFELICSLYLKMMEPKMRTVQSICLGGVTPDGADGANAVTKLCLRASTLLKTPYPNLSLRIDPQVSPAWVYREAARTVKAGNGMPLILNDKIWVNNLASLGIPVEFARDYYNMGCTEIMIAYRDCNWSTWAAGGVLEFANVLMDYLRETVKEERVFSDFDQFYDGFLKKLRKTVDELGDKCALFLENQRSMNCEPFASAFVEGCLESGRDYYQEGPATGDPLTIMGQGLGTAVDSISAIKKVVFDEHAASLSQLLALCENDFRGNEELAKRLKSASHYGNDDDTVDGLAQAFFEAYSDQTRKQNERHHLKKARIVNNVFSYNIHVQLGEGTMATPNGRKKGEPLSDCIGPSQGADTQGPTALLNSVLKLPQKDITGAFALNVKISPSLVKDEAGMRAFEQLLKVYIQEGGAEIQFNYQSADTLQKAQAEPEKYRDIVVRIAGYCEYFVNLDYKLQSEIIQRTLQETY